jgi:hypothetical protein
MDVSDTASSASRRKLSESSRKISFRIRSELLDDGGSLPRKNWLGVAMINDGTVLVAWRAWLPECLLGSGADTRCFRRAGARAGCWPRGSGRQGEQGLSLSGSTASAAGLDGRRRRVRRGPLLAASMHGLARTIGEVSIGTPPAHGVRGAGEQPAGAAGRDDGHETSGIRAPVPRSASSSPPK